MAIFKKRIPLSEYLQGRQSELGRNDNEMATIAEMPTQMYKALKQGHIELHGGKITEGLARACNITTQGLLQKILLTKKEFY